MANLINKLQDTLGNRKIVKDETNHTIAKLGKKINLNSFMNLDNPDEILKKGNLSHKHLKEAYRDPQVSAAFSLRKYQVLKLKWDIDRGVENELASVFIRDIVSKWNLPKIISGIIDARAWGFSVFEYTWLQEENFLKIVNVVQKPSHWFKFDSNSRLRFVDSSSSLGAVCTNYKFNLVQNEDTYDNPYGKSLLSECYWLARFKKDDLKLWATFIEKYGMPFFIGKTSTPNVEVLQAFFDMLEGLKQDGIAVIDNDQTVDKISGNDVSSKEIFESFFDKCDKQISKIILSHSDAIDATKGQLGNTSKALTTLDAIASADKELVENTINKIIQLLMEVNFSGFTHIPKFEMYEVADVDLELAQRDEILTKCGVSFTKTYLMNTYGFKETDLDVSKPLPAGPSFTEFSESETKINKIVSDMFTPFMDILDKGLDFEEVKKELHKKFNNLSDDDVEIIMSKLLLQATKGI